MRRGNKLENLKLYAEMVETCIEFPGLCRGPFLRWDRVNELVPKLVLKTHDHRLWSAGERRSIRELFLDGLIPKLRAENMKKRK